MSVNPNGSNSDRDQSFYNKDRYENQLKSVLSTLCDGRAESKIEMFRYTEGIYKNNGNICILVKKGYGTQFYNRLDDTNPDYYVGDMPHDHSPCRIYIFEPYPFNIVISNLEQLIKGRDLVDKY